MNLSEKKLLGKITQFIDPGHGFCGRCGITWSFVKGHTTNYDKGAGCFPLCESCWQELEPIDRVSYYEELIELWISQGSDVSNEKRSKIIKAVLDGK